MIDIYEKEIGALEEESRTTKKKIDNQEIDNQEIEKRLGSICNRIIKLDENINNIKDANKRKELQERLDRLKVKIANLVNDFINGETKDKDINNEIKIINNELYNKSKELLKEIEPGRLNIAKMFAQPLTIEEFRNTLEYYNIPIQDIIVGGDTYPGFLIKGNTEGNYYAFALINNELNFCEPDFEENNLGQGNAGINTNTKGTNIDYNKSAENHSMDNLYGTKNKMTFNKNIGKIKMFAGGERTGHNFSFLGGMKWKIVNASISTGLESYNPKLKLQVGKNFNINKSLSIKPSITYNKEINNGYFETPINYLTWKITAGYRINKNFTASFEGKYKKPSKGDPRNGLNIRANLLVKI